MYPSLWDREAPAAAHNYLLHEWDHNGRALPYCTFEPPGQPLGARGTFAVSAAGTVAVLIIGEGTKVAPLVHRAFLGTEGNLDFVDPRLPGPLTPCPGNQALIACWPVSCPYIGAQGSAAVGGSSATSGVGAAPPDLRELLQRATPASRQPDHHAQVIGGAPGPRSADPVGHPGLAHPPPGFLPYGPGAAACAPPHQMGPLVGTAVLVNSGPPAPPQGWMGHGAPPGGAPHAQLQPQPYGPGPFFPPRGPPPPHMDAPWPHPAFGQPPPPVGPRPRRPTDGSGFGRGHGRAHSPEAPRGRSPHPRTGGRGHRRGDPSQERALRKARAAERQLATAPPLAASTPPRRSQPGAGPGRPPGAGQPPQPAAQQPRATERGAEERPRRGGASGKRGRGKPPPRSRQADEEPDDVERLLHSEDPTEEDNSEKSS